MSLILCIVKSKIYNVIKKIIIDIMDKIIIIKDHKHIIYQLFFIINIL